MKGYLCSAGLLTAALLSAVPARAQGISPWQGGPMAPPGCGPAPYCQPAPCGPNACGPGYYWTNPCGATYQCWCLRPPVPPFQGARPPVSAGGGAGGGGPAGVAGFPSHLYARSPRDFFMIGDP